MNNQEAVLAQSRAMADQTIAHTGRQLDTLKNAYKQRLAQGGDPTDAAAILQHELVSCSNIMELANLVAVAVARLAAPSVGA